jgi:hypothetical protein
MPSETPHLCPDYRRRYDETLCIHEMSAAPNSPSWLKGTPESLKDPSYTKVLVKKYPVIFMVQLILKIYKY